MRTPLNSPLEVGTRVLMLLAAIYPEALDLNRLVLLDHGLLHSADLGGPQSLHPPLPIRAGELGMKRATIEQGLQVMLRAGLVDMAVGEEGLTYVAGERAHSFVNLLASNYANDLRRRAAWVVGHFDDLSEASLRRQLRGIFNTWAEEFAHADGVMATGQD